MNDNKIQIKVCTIALVETELKIKNKIGIISVLDSIRNQLNFMIDYFNGVHSDLEKFDKLNFGIIAVREIEDTDPQYASLLHSAYYVASLTMDGKVLPEQFVRDYN